MPQPLMPHQAAFTGPIRLTYIVPASTCIRLPQVKFPQRRLAMLTTSFGAFAASGDARCSNRQITSVLPAAQMAAALTIPCTREPEARGMGQQPFCCAGGELARASDVLLRSASQSLEGTSTWCAPACPMSMVLRCLKISSKPLILPSDATDDTPLASPSRMSRAVRAPNPEASPAAELRDTSAAGPLAAYHQAADRQQVSTSCAAATCELTRIDQRCTFGCSQRRLSLARTCARSACRQQPHMCVKRRPSPGLHAGESLTHQSLHGPASLKCTPNTHAGSKSSRETKG